MKKCKQAKYIVGYDKDKNEYGTIICGTLLSIHRIGKESVLSNCCNSLVLITLTQSELGRVKCINRSCMNPVVDYVHLSSEMVELLFREAEEMLYQSLLGTRQKQLRNMNLHSINYSESRRSRRKTQVIKSTKVPCRNLLAFEEIVKQKNVDRLLECINKFAQYITPNNTNTKIK